MHRDECLALDEGRRTGATLPTAAAARGVLEAAGELGYAQRDIAGLHQVLAKMSERT
ncbi:MAG TPA: hypothetical protein VH228_05360 [Nocardioides sp.]|jgi:3-hydroxyisobutyrate dehydrogenase-like beta-hydroxyacid dehydrogenase|nr:hypothetical protein [Nocardioides sp.]